MLATVKGDVHDIGKNIVGVVLGCNNYDVLDLGVMVPAEKILDTAVAEGADAVGLSGLITPSLDEMVHVAKEMERRGFALPLLIGGATTSRQHTAVRIAPAYEHPTVHVLDASRVVGVVADLLDPKRRSRLDEENRLEQARLRDLHAEKERRPLLPLGLARENRLALAFDRLETPAFTGTRTAEPDLATLCEFVDWQFFFHAWELKGKFPAILEQPAARELYDDALALLDEIVREGALRPGASTGSGRPAPRATTSCSRPVQRFPMLRQQAAWGDSRPNRSLADYVAPAGDHVGGVRGLDPRRRRACAAVRGGARRLPRDHGQGARRPARRGVRRVAAPGGAAALVRAGRRRRRRRSSTPSVSAASGRPSAIRRAPTTPRSAVCSTCSRPRGPGWS